MHTGCEVACTTKHNGVGLQEGEKKIQRRGKKGQINSAGRPHTQFLGLKHKFDPERVVSQTKKENMVDA